MKEIYGMINFYQKKIKQYSVERNKLIKEMDKYKNTKKKVPKEICKRIGECNMIINYCESEKNKILTLDEKINQIPANYAMQQARLINRL